MSGKAVKAYEELVARQVEIARLGSIMGLLGWDEQVNLPRAASAARAEQLAYLMGLMHRRATAPEIGELLSIVEGSELVADPAGDAAVNAREWRRAYDRLVKVPPSLMEELERQISLSQGIWVEARRKSDFSMFSPALERLIALRKDYARAIAPAAPLYDTLADDFEPGATAEELARVLSGLRDALVPLLSAISGSSRRADVSILRRDYPVERQRIFAQAAAAAIGFDFRAGRLDASPHPFCSGIAPGDTRLTTRYDPRQFGQAFFGVIHEAGHGMYDQGLPAAHWGTPRGTSAGMGVHESQSRLWENFVARSRPFWQHFLPRAQQVFPDALSDVSLDAFYFAVNHVEKQFIRVEADEVTYNLHVLLRFELETALFSDQLSVRDVPGAWNENFKAYFDMTPPNDALGCLQDIHWSGAAFGYFPSYSLGNIFAAQIYAQARKEIPDLEEGFTWGEFAPLLSWLREKVHAHGMTYRAPQLIEKITGGPIDHRPLITHLQAKYGELYGL
ncbi:carboxypeptidase M32 [bacterium]|nr:carboxypeptidase M32 [bacterium]